MAPSVTPAASLSQFKLSWPKTPEEVDDRTEKLMKEVRAVYDQVAEVSKEPERADWDNTMGLLASVYRRWSTGSSSLEFPAHVSTDAKLREASNESDKKMSAFAVEMSMRRDVYQALKAYKDRLDANDPNVTKPADPESERLLAKTMKDMERNGLHLDEETSRKVQEIKQKMSQMSITFSNNLNEENTKLDFSIEELKGCHDDFLTSLQKNDDGRLVVTLKYPHYFPIMKSCSVASTRQKIEQHFNSRCKGPNTEILETLVKLRHEVANLLGYETHAAYIIADRMAKSPEAVSNFLQDLNQKLAVRGQEELDDLKQLKSKECEATGTSYDGVINAWDFRYYMTMLMKERYDIDHNAIQQYFPLQHVTDEMLKIYQELLSLEFHKVENPGEVAYNPEVPVFAVYDSASGDFMGHFYLDLHPREGKYGHAACFGLQPGCEIEGDGGRQSSVAGMVANFTKPTEGKPSLLTHDEVVTYFHEFGHVMHQICSKAKYAKFAGTSVERDFVELPSQMLENWCWESDALQRMSSHWESKEPLPNDTISKLIKAKNANAALLTKRQIVLATFDQTIHRKPEAETAAILAQLNLDILGVPMTPDTNMAASFGHLAGGYDAQYYGYLWSEVFADDVYFTCFKTKGIFNKDQGMGYRTEILSRGGSRDGMDMLRTFLGRDPNNEAFLRSKGLID
eukprot:Clim_evm39s229 gene=Clim_evmTU39s229